MRIVLESRTAVNDRRNGRDQGVTRGRPDATQRSWNFWRSLGPGIITGAADDDPSGIATYSIAGAQYGTSLLWTSPFTWPLMIGVQAMCARIGMVTGRGLLGAFRLSFPRPALVAVAGGLFVANTVNVGADLTAMADAAALLSGVRSHWWVFGFGVLIAMATIHLRYRTLARALAWLALFLFAYVLTALHARPTWSDLGHGLVPHVPRSRAEWATLVAILGTTISPYLFFWQASQEVEEEKALGRRRLDDRLGASRTELRNRTADVAIGTFFSNIVSYFIILATALTLHRAGRTTVTSSRDVAAALVPLAGEHAALLYTIGLLGTGALAIPTLSGSAAYAFAELFGWRQGMDEPYRHARSFYAVFIASIAIGMALDFAHVNPILGLYWTAVINGVLAPFLLLGVLVTASNARVMGGQPSPIAGRLVVAVTAALMFAAAGGMFIF